MVTVILCGGKGTRMGKNIQGPPKVLLNIGNKPIIWHIMKYYCHFGFNDFILCLGYKAQDIIDYFKKSKEFKIRFINTGIETNTGGRIRRIEKYINSDVFFATYGDGLSNINLKALLDFHRTHKKTASLTVVRPHTTFGIVGIDSHTSLVSHFEEKPVLDHWINGGFFVFNKGIFKYLRGNDILEKDSFRRLVENKELAAYKHCGFWECMDTYKDNLKLNGLWLNGSAHRALWKRK